MIPARPFYLIRHGETVMNALRRCCGGGVDTVLNEDGRAQAQMAAQVLRAVCDADDNAPTLIIISGMSRTRETTEVVNQYTNIPVLVDRDLREHMMGEWEQQPWDEILPALRAGHKPAGGESSAEYATRIQAALTRNLDAHPDARILFVAHGGTFHSLLKLYDMGRHIFIPNATLHHFAPDVGLPRMPWRIRMFAWSDGLQENPAPICPSQPDPDHDSYFKPQKTSAA